MEAPLGTKEKETKDDTQDAVKSPVMMMPDAVTENDKEISFTKETTPPLTDLEAGVVENGAEQRSADKETIREASSLGTLSPPTTTFFNPAVLPVGESVRCGGVLAASPPCHFLNQTQYSVPNLDGWLSEEKRQIPEGIGSRLVDLQPRLPYGDPYPRPYPTFTSSLLPSDPYPPLFMNKIGELDRMLFPPEPVRVGEDNTGLTSGQGTIKLTTRAPPSYLQLLESIVSQDCPPRRFVRRDLLEVPGGRSGLVSPSIVAPPRLIRRAPSATVVREAPADDRTPSSAPPGPSGPSSPEKEPSTAPPPPKCVIEEPQPCTSRQALAEEAAAKRRYQLTPLLPDFRKMSPDDQVKSANELSNRLTHILESQKKKKQEDLEGKRKAPAEKRAKCGAGENEEEIRIAGEKLGAESVRQPLQSIGALPRPDMQILTAVGLSTMKKDQVIQWPFGGEALLPSALLPGTKRGPSATPTVDKILMPPPPPPRPGGGGGAKKKRRITTLFARPMMMPYGARGFQGIHRRRSLIRRRRIPPPLPKPEVIKFPVDTGVVGWVKTHEWEVETIVASKLESDLHGIENRFYLVKWKGWDEDFNEWILEKDVGSMYVKAYWNRVLHESAARNACLPTLARGIVETAACGSPAPLCFFGADQDYAGV